MFRRSNGLTEEEAATPADDEEVVYPGADAPVAAASPTATTVPVSTAAAPRRVVRRTSVASPSTSAGLRTVGLFALVVGAWAGIVPFVGPIFGFNATHSSAWHWSLPHALVWLIPGGVAVIYALTLMSRAPRMREGLGRFGTAWAGLVIVVCGAWLVVGPAAWPVLEGVRAIRKASPLHELVYWIGYSMGPGLLLALLGGIAVGTAIANKQVATELATEAPLVGETLAA